MSSITKVAVVGANGKVARRLINKLHGLPDKFEPLAIIRNKDQVKKFSDIGIKSKVVSLEEPVLNIAGALEGANAVVFSAGAGGKGLDKTFSIDLDGAVKVFEAAEKVGIKRIVLVSAIKAEDRDFWYNNELRSYYIAKKYADRELRRTKLDWTILQPGYLSDGEGTGKVTDEIGNKKIADLQIDRDDVAQVIADSLQEPNTIHKTITLVKGQTPIKQFLSSLK